MGLLLPLLDTHVHNSALHQGLNVSAAQCVEFKVCKNFCGPTQHVFLMFF